MGHKAGTFPQPRLLSEVECQSPGGEDPSAPERTTGVGLSLSVFTSGQLNGPRDSLSEALG